MEAPKCPEEGCKPKQIYPGMSSTTLMYSAPYWEDGKYHDHDMNTTTTEYRCSEGHTWRVDSPPQSCLSCSDRPT